MSPEDLAHAYASATVGLCLSLTNPSLVPHGDARLRLPVVDVALRRDAGHLRPGGPVLLAEPTRWRSPDAMESLLDDLALRAELSRAGPGARRRAHVGGGRRAGRARPRAALLAGE
jgi:hypothetical protein